MKIDFTKIYREAKEAGQAALTAATPVPMVVSEADGLSDRPKPGGKSWFVEGGVCGFAWVKVWAKDPMAKAFLSWLKKSGLLAKKAHDGTGRYEWSAAYGGGFEFWIREGGQSMQRKEAFAGAMAEHLTKHGIPAYMGSRMD
jgi:hypothetical protein